WRWTSRASSPPRGRSRKARTIRTRERSMSLHQPRRLPEGGQHRDRQAGGEERREQRLPDDHADRDAPHADRNDDGRGEVHPAGREEGDGELGEGALPEQDLPNLEDDRARAEEEEGVEAERAGAAGVLEQPEEPGGQQSLGGVPREERRIAGERQQRLGTDPLHGPAVQHGELARQEDGAQKQEFGRAVPGHGRPPGSAAARWSGGGTRTMTCSSERK